MRPPSITHSICIAALLGLSACSTSGKPRAGTFSAATLGNDFMVKDPVSRKRELDPQRSACDTDATIKLPLGTTKFTTLEETATALAGTVLLPDPATLPEGTNFGYAYYHASIEGSFKQSTIGVIFFTPPLTKGGEAEELAINSFNSAFSELPPFIPAQEITVRGIPGYGYNIPLKTGLHAVQWYDGCRYSGVSAMLPALQVLAIAEGLKVAPNTSAGPTAVPAASATPSQ